MRIQPRLRLDIGWSDLASALPPPRQDRATIEARIASAAPDGTVAVVGLSVRTLFDAILAETAAGRPVAMSAVTIQDMAAIVRAHGCELRSVDIGLDTLAPEPDAWVASGDGAALIVLVHLYGRRSPIEAVAAAWAGASARPLIVEDCAQAFDGALRLSAGADVALYSFGPIKIATALGGAVALFRDPDLARRVSARIASYVVLPETWFLRRLLKTALLKAASQPVLYGLVIRALVLSGRDPDRVIGAASRSFPGTAPIVQSVRRAPPLRLLALLARRLAGWRPTVDPALDRATAERLATLALVPGLAATGTWWLLPILHPRPEDVVLNLRARGFDATRGATSMRAIADRVAEPAVASRLLAEIVYVPKPTSPRGAVLLERACADALGVTRRRIV